MAGELGRDVGDLLKAKDLGGGETAGEGGLLHLPRSPADQGGQRCRRQVELGGDPWSEGVVTKLPPTPQLQHLADGKLPFGDDGAGQQGENQTFWMAVPCAGSHIECDDISHFFGLGPKDP